MMWGDLTRFSTAQGMMWTFAGGFNRLDARSVSVLRRLFGIIGVRPSGSTSSNNTDMGRLKRCWCASILSTSIYLAVVFGGAESTPLPNSAYWFVRRLSIGVY